MINIKKSGRFSFRPNKRHNYSRTNNSYVSNRPRSKGGIVQLHEKYIKLAKESFSVGDRIQAEYYNQFADHYSRLMIEQGLKPSNNENIENVDDVSEKKSLEVSSLENDSETSKSSINSNIKSTKKVNIEEEEEDEVDEIDNTLKTVSFISQPAKKTAKLKK